MHRCCWHTLSFRQLDRHCRRSTSRRMHRCIRLGSRPRDGSLSTVGRRTRPSACIGSGCTGLIGPSLRTGWRISFASACVDQFAQDIPRRIDSLMKVSALLMRVRTLEANRNGSSRLADCKRQTHADHLANQRICIESGLKLNVERLKCHPSLRLQNLIGVRQDVNVTNSDGRRLALEQLLSNASQRASLDTLERREALLQRGRPFQHPAAGRSQARGSSPVLQHARALKLCLSNSRLVVSSLSHQRRS